MSNVLPAISSLALAYECYYSIAVTSSAWLFLPLTDYHLVPFLRYRFHWVYFELTTYYGGSKALLGNLFYRTLILIELVL